MHLSETEPETRQREARTEAAPVPARRPRRTPWVARAAVAVVAAAATIALVVMMRSDDGRLDTVGNDRSGPSTTPTESSAPEPPGSSTTPTTSAAPVAAAAVGPDTPVSPSGIGPIQVGMTLSEAERAAGMTITPGEPVGPGSNCVEARIGDFEIYLQLAISGVPGEDLRQGVVMLVLGQGIRRTVEGVAVGDPMAEVTATYGTPTRTTDYPYLPNGEVLVYENGGRAYGVVGDGSTVTGIQSGDTTWTPAVEGCV
jgi:hypothetical protein